MISASSRAVIAAAAALTALTGCGFQPLYGGPGYAALPGVEIEAGENRIDYLLEDSLRDHLGPGRSGYVLMLDSDVRESSLGLSASGLASRFSLEMTVSYSLSRDGDEPIDGFVRDSVQFDASTDPFALISARADAEERLSDVVADRLIQNISAALRRREAGLPS